MLLSRIKILPQSVGFTSILKSNSSSYSHLWNRKQWNTVEFQNKKLSQFVNTKHVVRTFGSAPLLTSQILPKTLISPQINYLRKYSNQKEREGEEPPIKEDELSEEARNSIARWLFICGGMVFGMVVLGGVTRLTESGLSITEWKPITGTLPPLNEEQWEAEFAKYKQSPEYNKLNYGMSVEDFKKIFYMEWGHRFFGRVIGLAYFLPFVYYLNKGWLKGKLLYHCVGLLGMGGLQGALGWYMVKSGLDEKEFEDNNSVPRVSHYRLAAHLSAAVALYTGLIWMGLKLKNPTNYGTNYGGPATKIMQRAALFTTGLVYLTAFSGALVAGLDAGLIYNTYPLMGEQWIPEEILRMSPTWLNLFENSTTVQFDHRWLGTATFTTVSLFYITALRKLKLSPRSRIALHSLFGAVCLQFVLGISTLLTFVPVSLASMHQAGAMTLITTSLWTLKELKRLPRIK